MASGRDAPLDEQQWGPATLPVTFVDVHRGKPVRLQVKVVVPTNDHPNYNFVGKLLGPKGNSLKWLQERSQTKMAILGRGSMRNKEKEMELREKGDPKYAHLSEDLHVEITAYAPAPEAYQRISSALFEIKRFLVPDYYDEIRKQQLKELGVISAEEVDSSGSFHVHSHSECSPPGIVRNGDIPSLPSPYAAALDTVDNLCPVGSFWAQPEVAVNGQATNIRGSQSHYVPLKSKPLKPHLIQKPYSRPVRNTS